MKTRVRRFVAPAVVCLAVLAISLPFLAESAGSGASSNAHPGPLPWGLCPLIAAPLFPILHVLLPP